MALISLTQNYYTEIAFVVVFFLKQQEYISSKEKQSGICLNMKNNTVLDFFYSDASIV